MSTPNRVGRVHNHGPYDGPGMACPEHVVNGRLIGDCIGTPRTESQGAEAQFGCLTGDCPHQTQAECDAWVRAELIAQAQQIDRLRVALARYEGGAE